MLQLYFPVLLFIIVGIGLGLIMLALGSLVSPSHPDPEKLAPYECGLEAFEDARMKFDVRYYLIAILFILFDLEIAFLFPWAVVLPEIGIFGFWSMMIFLAILIVGFIYGWKRGALEWEWRRELPAEGPPAQRGDRRGIASRRWRPTRKGRQT